MELSMNLVGLRLDFSLNLEGLRLGLSLHLEVLRLGVNLEPRKAKIRVVFALNETKIVTNDDTYPLGQMRLRWADEPMIGLNLWHWSKLAVRKSRRTKITDGLKSVTLWCPYECTW